MLDSVKEWLVASAVLVSLFGPFLIGTWLMRRSGARFTKAVRTGLWMMVYSVLPMLAVAVVGGLMGDPYMPWILALMPVATFLFFRRLARNQSVEPGRDAVASSAAVTDDEVMQAYGQVLERSAPAPGCIADESKLPHPKVRIRATLLNALRRADDDVQRNVLATAYLCLADWQPGVGYEDVGIDLLDGQYSADLRQRAEQIAAVRARAEPFELLRERESEQLRQDLAILRVRLTSENSN